MPEDFLQSPVVTCNMASIVRVGNPHPRRESHLTTTLRGSIIVIDWLQNSLTNQDHHKGVTIPITTYRYNMGGISIALAGSIQDPPLRSSRITRLPMIP